MSATLTRPVLLLALLFGTAAGAQPSPDDSQRERELSAEVNRLKEVLERSFQERMRYKKELKEVRVTIGQLRTENAELRQLVKASKVGDGLDAAAEELLQFFRWLDIQLSAADGTEAQRKWLYAVLSGTMEEWISDQAAGRRLLRPSLSWMKQRVEQLDAGARQEPEKPRESQRTVSESEVWIRPQAICELLNIKNAEQRVQFLSRLVGQQVYWTGTVAGGIDDRNAPYQVELRRDDVVIFVNVRKKKRGSLKWVKIGKEARVEGRIADVGDTIGSCISVLVVDGKLRRPG